eukprot:superscaffoldBa00003032_g15936
MNQLPVTDDDTVKRYYAKFEERFFQTCEKELLKINTFYSEKLAEAQRRFATLQNELQSSLDAQRESNVPPGLRKRKTMFHLSQEERCKHHNIKDLKLAFSEFYLSLILLQNYQNLNFTGFRKILKKHDKILDTPRGADWRVAHVEFRVFTAPFHRVEFADFWLADQLNSLVVVLMDMEYLICFYIFELQWSNSKGLLPTIKDSSDFVCHSYSYGLRAIIQCLPAWFRFIQCLRRYRDTKRAFPHLVNAGKYSTTFFVVTFAALYATHREQGHTDADMFFYLLIVFSTVSSLYTLIWDLRMDWGLFDRGAGENTFLREEIVYPHKAYYYCAILEDVILRFAWTIQISLTTMTKIHSVGDIVATVLAPLEVFRRFVWNFFRLENEHLNNCGEFRAVRDISVAPLNADDQTLLEQMMDQEDGVRNRSGKKTWKRSYSLSLRRPLLSSS